MKTRCALSRHRKDARVYALTTTAICDMSPCFEWLGGLTSVRERLFGIALTSFADIVGCDGVGLHIKRGSCRRQTQSDLLIYAI